MIELFTAATPNGYKVSIALEELGLPYRVRALDFSAKDQKRPEFLAINPNGRIPAIIDRGANDFKVFESGAILIYLAEKAKRLLPLEPFKRSEVLQWLMFQMGGLGPMQGQAHVFLNYAPEKISFAIERYQNETRRLYKVLNERLVNRTFLAGGYSIADIATFPWVGAHDWAAISLGPFPHLSRWLEMINERPAVQRGLAVPERIEIETEEQRKTLSEMGKSMI